MGRFCFKIFPICSSLHTCTKILLLRLLQDAMTAYPKRLWKKFCFKESNNWMLKIVKAIHCFSGACHHFQIQTGLVTHSRKGAFFSYIGKVGGELCAKFGQSSLWTSPNVASILLFLSSCHELTFLSNCFILHLL